MNYLVKKLLCVAIFLLVVLLLPGIPPNISYEIIKLTPPIKLEGKFAPIYVLDKATKVIEGEFTGAESILLNGSTLYTAVIGGKLIKFEDKLGLNGNEIRDVKVKVEEIARFGKPCQLNKNEICKENSIGGGLRFDPSGNIVLVDVSYGVFSVDLTTGKSGYLFTADSTVVNGLPLKLPDDLDIGQDGTIYFSDFASTYTVEEFSLEKSFDSSGRLMKYDPKSRTISVLLTGLIGANGVQLSENEDFVLVTESISSRVTRYYLKGPKAGTTDVFVDELPGITDNIRENGRGGYYIALAGPRSFLIDNLSDHPQLRKLLFRLGWLARLPLELLNRMGIQNSCLNDLHHFMSNYGSLGINLFSKPVVVDVDAGGSIRRILTTRKDEVKHATQLTIGRDYAYFGGLTSNQIWRIAMVDLEKGLN